jgi:hypothetical protein
MMIRARGTYLKEWYGCDRVNDSSQLTTELNTDSNITIDATNP